METELWPAKDFLSKIEWEGGIGGAMEYGLPAHEYDLPEDLVSLWSEVAEYYRELDGAVRELSEKCGYEDGDY